jgi:hypothetical protein
MHSYTVIDINSSTRLVALRDPDGRYHAAHCTSGLPLVGQELRGALPERGFTLLIQSDGAVCRMTFSEVNRGQAWVFGVLHPSAATPIKPLTSTLRSDRDRSLQQATLADIPGKCQLAFQ